MELVAIIAVIVVVVIGRQAGRRETGTVIDRRDTWQPPHHRTGACPKPSTGAAARPEPARDRPCDTTPTPLGARSELTPRHRRALSLAEKAGHAGGTTLRGRAWVVDGDTIVIDKTHIRLAGIDAPELDHPYGRLSRSAMIRLCKGRTVTAEIRPDLSYDRVVAVCRLEDGTDLAEALVRQGLALDWRTYSGGQYRSAEPPDARKKLWKTALRQGRGGR